MGIKIQKILGSILLALIVVVSIRMFGDVLTPAPEPKESAYKVAGGQGAASSGQAPAAEKPFPVLLAAAKPEDGAKVAKKCTSCHSFEAGGANKVGPNLAGVVGADKASKAGFAYSAALTGLPGSWTYEDLNKFLTKPGDYAPGTKMTFAGLSKAEDRANIIAYMRSLSPNAPPLPKATP